jgi:L-aminopeptidase/D-esterase-like protein
VGGVDVRGAAPGTRETDLLHPANLVGVVHAVLLSGGSAWGLDAATGVMRWLEEHGHGLQRGRWPGADRCPSCPAPCCSTCTWAMPASGPMPPRATQPAQPPARARPAQGGVGAGAGATVGKLFGMAHAMKGGIGSAASPWVASRWAR